MKNKPCNHFTILAIFAAFAIIGASCSQDVVTVDLNHANPHIVIEGAVTEGPGPHTVRISKTADFFTPADYPSVSGAMVTIGDDTGNVETLVERTPGIYTTETVQGVTGRTYTLSVETEGMGYRASSTMNVTGHIDSLAFEVDDEDAEEFIVHCYFTDTVNVKEYYRFKLNITGEYYDEYSMYQDRLTDGNQLDFELWIHDEIIENGDSIIVEMQSIDRPVYQYFSTLADAATESSSGLSMFTGTPANPTSNISNDALGYFSAYTVVFDTLMVAKSGTIK